MSKPTLARKLLKIAALTIVGLTLALLIAFSGIMFALVRLSASRPDLRPWHTTAPQSEFVADQEDGKYNFSDYLAQEAKTFAELDRLIRVDWANEPTGPLSRYKADSICYGSTIFGQDWNRTTVLEAKNPIGGVLLLHGLSDGPYSLRLLGQRLHQQGYTVIWLRLPGHGTTPKALADATWPDWAAATRIAMTELRKRVPDPLPLIMVGYSNGGAVSVNHALENLLSEKSPFAYPQPSAIVLVSPMIGITPMAALTELYPLVSRITGDEKLSWGIIEPEIDPFQFASAPIASGLQAHRFTRHIESAINTLVQNGRMKDFPPVLTVQSSADATVVAHKMIDILMDRLPPGPSQLILFDINRTNWLDGLTFNNVERNMTPRLERENRNFTLTLVTNRTPSTLELIARTTPPNNATATETPLGFSWPKDVFSLSHVALAISPSDPIYGANDPASPARIPLGTLSLRGESGVLSISPRLLMRQRYNPFYHWTESQILSWLAARNPLSPNPPLPPSPTPAPAPSTPQ